MPAMISDGAARKLAGGIVRFSEDVRKAYGQFSRHLDGSRLRDELAGLHRSFAYELIGLIEEEAERRRRAKNGASRGRRRPVVRRDR